MTTPTETATRQAFATFLERGAYGCDWPAWAALFRHDAVYTEHCLGQFRGAAAIEAWIVAAMEPVACMTFSVEWSIVEGDRVAFWIWNHLPGIAGAEFCFPNLSVLTLAADGWWSAEEDFYEPAWTSCVIDWFRAGGSAAMAPQPGLRPRVGSHPAPPEHGPERSVVAAALATMAPAGTTLRYDVIAGAVGVGAFDSAERAHAVMVHVDAAGAVVFSQVVANPTETTNPCR